MVGKKRQRLYDSKNRENQANMYSHTNITEVTTLNRPASFLLPGCRIVLQVVDKCTCTYPSLFLILDSGMTVTQGPARQE
jgi:hypothetical protein